jgi:hypothetical protein
MQNNLAELAVKAVADQWFKPSSARIFVALSFDSTPE